MLETKAVCLGQLISWSIVCHVAGHCCTYVLTSKLYHTGFYEYRAPLVGPLGLQSSAIKRLGVLTSGGMKQQGN